MNKDKRTMEAEDDDSVDAVRFPFRALKDRDKRDIDCYNRQRSLGWPNNYCRLLYRVAMLRVYERLLRRARHRAGFTTAPAHVDWWSTDCAWWLNEGASRFVPFDDWWASVGLPGAAPFITVEQRDFFLRERRSWGEEGWQCQNDDEDEVDDKLLAEAKKLLKARRPAPVIAPSTPVIDTPSLSLDDNLNLLAALIRERFPSSSATEKSVAVSKTPHKSNKSGRRKSAPATPKPVEPFHSGDSEDSANEGGYESALLCSVVEVVVDSQHVTLSDVLSDVETAESKCALPVVEAEYDNTSVDFPEVVAAESSSSDDASEAVSQSGNVVGDVYVGDVDHDDGLCSESGSPQMSVRGDVYNDGCQCSFTCDCGLSWCFDEQPAPCADDDVNVQDGHPDCIEAHDNSYCAVGDYDESYGPFDDAGYASEGYDSPGSVYDG
jgi:hypothetical protein